MLKNIVLGLMVLILLIKEVLIYRNFTKAQDKLKSENGIQRLIYLFDEAEVLMGQRGGENHDENDKRINTLMTNLQKIHDSDSQEYLFFITNEPKLMDKASIRSQRIDQVIEFTLPEVGPRRQLFQYSIQQLNEKLVFLVSLKKNIYLELFFSLYRFSIITN